jgi:hypothetical protein
MKGCAPSFSAGAKGTEIIGHSPVGVRDRGIERSDRRQATLV